MKKKLEHLTSLVGLGIYIVLGAAGCAAYVAGVALVLDDFVFQVNIPRAYLLGTLVGIVVSYALYLAHAEHIKINVDYFAENHPVFKWFGAIGASALVALVILYAPIKKADPQSQHQAVEVVARAPAPDAAPHEQTSVTKVSDDQVLPSSTQAETRPASVENDIYALALLPYPLGGTSLERSKYPPVDPCELNGAFSDKRYKACLDDIRKNPNRKGIGGPAYDDVYGNKRSGAGSRGRSNKPLDIKPVR